MPKNKMTKKLVEAFNFDNRFYRIIDTNLILESRWNGDFIVIKFDKNMNAEQCVSYMNDFKNKVVERFYETEKGAGIAFDIESFPFNLGKGKLQPSKKGMRYVAPIEDGTIFNLKCYLISSFASDIEEKLGEIFGVGYLEDLTRSMKFDRRHYLYCTDFRDKEVRDKFIELFRSEIESHNNVSSSLLKVEGNCVYVKDIFKNNIPLIDSMIERNLWLMGRHLQVPSNEDEYVEAIKDKITDLVHVKSSIPIYIIFHASYLGSKDNSVLIPVVQSFDGSFRSLTQKEAKNINKVFGYSVLHNVDDCITKKQLTELLGEGYKKGVYGINFYDKEISYCVLNKIMESSVINKDHELSIDPELPRTLLAEPSPKQEFPTCSQGVASKDSPRQGSEREEETEPFLGVLEIDPSQSTCDQSQLSLGADESMLIEIRGQQVRYRPSLIPSPRAWNNSIFSDLGVSEDSPKDTKNICNEEPEKQQVTDKSDRKSSDECSDAKPQSESPSSRKGSESNSFSGSSTLSKKSIMPELEKLFILELEKWFLYFQQNGKKLDSTRSTHELSSKKTATSSERKVKSNSPSKVTPVTEVHTENKPTELNDSITELPSQGTVGKLNMPGDRSSKISVDSGLGSLERGQSPSLIEEFSDSLQQTPLIVDKLENILSKLLSVVHNLLKNPASPTHKDVSGGLKLQQHLDSDQREKLYKALSSKMKKKLDSELFLPEYEKLLYLLYVDKREVRLLLSPPGEVEQVCSVLPSEEKEQAQSSSSEEVVRLFQEFFSNQKVSDNYLTSSKDSGVSLGSSSQKSTSDTGSDEDELEASGRSSVSSSPSSESVSSVIEKVRVGSPFSLKGK